MKAAYDSQSGAADFDALLVCVPAGLCVVEKMKTRMALHIHYIDLVYWHSCLRPHDCHDILAREGFHKRVVSKHRDHTRLGQTLSWVEGTWP